MDIIKNTQNYIKFIIGKENYEFAKHAKNYVSSEVIVKGLYFITIPIITRLLSASEYGILSIYLSIINILSIVLMLNFHGAVIRYYYEDNNDFSEFLGTVLIVIFLFNVIFIPILYFSRTYVSDFLRIPSNVFFLSVVSAFLVIPYKIYRSFLIASKKSKQYSWLTISNSTLIIGFSIILMILLDKNRYLGEIYSRIIITIIISIYIIYKFIGIAKFSFFYSHFKYAFSFSIPLMLGSLSGFILNFFDRLIINQLTNSRATGLYSLSYNIGMAMLVIIHASNKAWGPVFYEKLKKKEYELISNLSINYIKVILLISISLILFSKEIIYIMADKSYYEAIDVLPIIILGYIFNFFFIFYTNFLEFMKKTGKISRNIFISCLINVGLNYLLIPKYGYKIAAYTTMFSYFILFLVTFFSIKQYKIWIIPIKNIICPFICLLIVFFMYYIINMLISKYIFLFLLKLIILLILGLVFFQKPLALLLQGGDKN